MSESLCDSQTLFMDSAPGLDAALSFSLNGPAWVYADGSVHSLSYNIPQDIYRALSTRNGGEVINWDE